MENIPTDFTNGNIPPVYDEEIIVGNKIIKTKQKKWSRDNFINEITDEIYSVSKICRQNRW